VPATAQGKNGKCPACQTVFKIPAAPAVTPKGPSKQALQVGPSKQALKVAAPPSPPDIFDFAPQSATAQSTDTTFPDLSAEPPAKIKYPDPEEHGSFRLEKKGLEKGVLGGIAMIAVAVVWFVVGLLCGYVFFYPPILLVIGIFAVIKGLATGNLAGGKPTRKMT
jgi:hypothetical protein